ncbi:ECF RNA polymerase sigma factor SigK [Alloalcanivorax gelatiniphagus]
MPSTTEELLLRTARNDEEALALLYDKTSPVVYGLALCLLRDDERAQAVTVEVFVEVWRTAALFDPAAGTAAGWVMAIAHRRAVDGVRSAPLADAGDRGSRAAASHALAVLPESHRRALGLTYFDGQSCHTVSGVLRQSSGTTLEHVRDALVSLRGHRAPAVADRTP